MVLPFVSPPCWFCELQVWKRREPSGESSPPDSRPAWRRRVWQKSRQPVKAICRKRRLQIRVPETPSAFHPHAQQNAFPSSRCASAIQIVCPSESSPETQPQPTQTGFAKILSEDLPGLHAHLKCGERILESRINPGHRKFFTR